MIFMRWVVLCAAAEYAGIAVAALCFGIVAMSFGEPDTFGARLAVWFFSSAAGIPEGLVLGSIQSFGIRRIFEVAHDRSAILIRTIIAAVIGWTAGTFVPTFIPFDAPDATTAPEDPPLYATILFAALFGIIAGALFGWLQSGAFAEKTLRREWLIANTLGWMVGLPAIYLFAQTGGDLPGWTAKIAMWAAGGALAGASIGIATGIPLARAAGRSATGQSPIP